MFRMPHHALLGIQQPGPPEDVFISQGHVFSQQQQQQGHLEPQVCTPDSGYSIANSMCMQLPSTSDLLRVRTSVGVRD